MIAPRHQRRSGAEATSIHGLNGDRPLPFGHAGKLAYFLLNWLNNSLPDWRVDPRLAIRDFQCSRLASRCAQLGTGASPSRTLSDLFWLTLPWARIQAELGTIRILDVGCGSGHYGPRMISWSGDRVASYVGVDVHAHESWPGLEREDRRQRFIQVDASDLGCAIPAGTNFVTSQSAIEHMDGDLRFFEQIRDHVLGLGAPALQVHLCPSAACLRLYLLHGVRQYTPRTLSHITRLFEDGYAMLYRLGGRACNRLHYQFITAPLRIWRRGDLRVTRADEYARRLLAVVDADMACPQPSPAFYALVIHTSPRARLF